MDEEGGHVGGFEAHGVKHAGPVDGMSGDKDVFPDNLEVGGPEGIKFRKVAAVRLPVSREGDVVDQSVEPDIGHEVRIEGEGNSPGESVLGPGDAEIGVTGSFDGVDDFCFTKFRDDFEIIIFDGGAQPVGVFGELEIPVFLFAFFHLTPFRAEVAFLVAVAVGQVLFLADGVEAGIGFFVERAFFLEVGENGLDTVFVPVVDRFGPAVVFDAEFLPELDEALGVSLGEGCDVYPCLLYTSPSPRDRG